jgi:hypothetical protein
MSKDTAALTPDRRSFLKTVGAAALSLGADRAAGASAPPSAAQTRPNVRLGLDMYSVGAQQWTPFEQMDFAAKWNVKMVHFSEIRFLGSPDWKRSRSIRPTCGRSGPAPTS